MGGEVVGGRGVDADRESHLRPEPLDLLRLGGLLRVAGRQDDQCPLDACSSRAGHNGIQISGKGFICQMAVAVYHLLLALGPHPQRELTLMPRLGVAWPRFGMAAGAEKAVPAAVTAPWFRVVVAHRT